MTTEERASRLLELHRDRDLLTLVNVWDVASARVVGAAPGTRALATASHAIAAMLGYEDGERIPVDEMLTVVGRIAAATELPVSADLEAGYGDAGETVRRAIGLGVVGANIEDRMAPLDQAVRAVTAALEAARAEGVDDFVLNARTDAFLQPQGREPAERLAEAVRRGRAFLDAGAPVVFVPGLLDEHDVATLTDAFGPRRLSVLAVPGSLPLDRLQDLGVGRVSFGPWPQRVALTALQHLVGRVHHGGGLPGGVEPLA